jgi:hypothetical protein
MSVIGIFADQSRPASRRLASSNNSALRRNGRRFSIAFSNHHNATRCGCSAVNCNGFADKLWESGLALLHSAFDVINHSNNTSHAALESVILRFSFKSLFIRALIFSRGNTVVTFRIIGAIRATTLRFTVWVCVATSDERQRVSVRREQLEIQEKRGRKSGHEQSSDFSQTPSRV